MGDIKWISFTVLYILIFDLNSFKAFGAAPSFTTPSGGTDTTSVDEDVVTGTSVYSVTATDADGDSLTYSVTGSAVSHFQVDGQIVKTVSTFDYESTTSYDVEVACSDGTGNVVTATVTVNINDVNEFTPVFNPSIIAATVAENTGSGTTVASLACSDSDTSTTSCTLSIQSGDTSSNFQISGNDIITTSNAINYESLSSQSYIYTLVVIGTDVVSSTKTGTATVYVTVTNQNEGTPSISGTTPDPVSVSEDASVGTSVCTVTASDTDDGVYGTISFAIDSGNTGTAFSIDASSGVIYTAASLDKETLSSYNLVVSASDGASPALSSTYTVAITVNDVNDNAPTCSPDVNSVDVLETATLGTSVLTLACTDADGDSLNFAIASGNSGNEFSLTAAGALSLNSALDFDSGSTSFQLLIDVDDSSTTSTTTVNVNVVAQNEATPAFASNPTVNINENEAVGFSVTTYTATDGDASPHDITQYTISSATNSGSSKFSIDKSSGLITLAQTLDYETTTSYEITVRAADGGGSIGSGTVTVSVTDVNDNSPVCTSYSYAISVAEDTGTGTAVIANFGCTDADASASLTYTLSLTPNDGSFTASSSLSVASALDYESQTSYTGTVTVSDGTNSVTISLSITIENVNEHTPAISGTNPSTISIAEDSVVSTSVCTVLATDSDSGTDGDLTYAIISGDSGSEFTIDSASGVIYTAKALDYENTQSYTLTVQATDGGATPLSATLAISVSVTDINDNVPVCTPYVYNVDVSESASIGTTVETMTCTDGDSNTLTYAINSGNSAGKFALGSTVATANEVTLNAVVDYDSGTTSYILIINVDDGTYTATTTVNVNVVAVNEATPSFASNPTFTVAEDATIGSTVATYTATDSDASPYGIVSYSINAVTNSGSSLFTIDASTAVIQLANSLDYETTQVYEITVVATDGGSQQGSGTVTVSVSDVNDNTPTCTTYAYALDVNENTATSTTVISDFGCSDSDAGTSLTYTLSITPSGGFTVSGTSLIVAGTLDYETATSYSGSVTVSDGTLSTTISIDVAIGNLNDNTPSISGTNPSTISLAENTAVGTSVCTVQATDGDSGTFGVLSYSIIAGNSGSEFTIDSSTGQISTTKSLDYESAQSYSLTVQADDGGSPALTATYVISISVTDVNDNQPTCSPMVYNVDVTETASVGTTVATLTCTDGDSNTLSYAINSGNGAGKFALGSTVATANEVTLNAAVDFESGTTSYTLLINVDDSTYTASVTVNVNIVEANEDTPAFSANPTVTIAEDSSVGTVVTTYAASDGDSSPHDITSYIIQSATNSGTSFFTMDSSTGAISLTQSLDYETTTSYELTVVATDGGGLAGTGTVTVSVTDMNDNIPQCTQTAYALTVAEDQAVATVVESLTCSDGDGNSLTYTMTQNPGSKFSVSASGDVSVNGALDYETTRFYQLQVTITDNGSPATSSSVDIDVSITNVNEGAPVFVGTYSVTVPEDTSLGSTLITVVTTDVDSDTIAYSFQTTYSNFIIDSSSGAILLTQTLDYDTTQTHSLLVVASDGTATTTATATVVVTDVNESPVFATSPYTATLDENVSVGTILTTVAATDPDSAALGTITYAITSGNGGSYFTIGASSGVITTTASIDYEATTAFTIIVEASDGGTPSLSASCLVEVTITDLNDNAPTFVATTYNLNIAEDSAVGYSVTTVTATDADSSSNNNNVFQYSTSSSVPFTIGTTSGEITVNSALDRETTASYTMVILATDQGSPAQTGSLTLTITLDDVNDNDPVISGTYDTTISEYTSVNTIVFTITATDADDGVNSALQYSFVSGNTNSDFSIEQNSGIIQTVNSLDRETTSSYNLLVQVIDQGTSARSATITATVTISDENDNTPTFTQASFSFNVDENVGTGTSVGELSATDSDTGVNSALSYSIVGYWVGGSNPFSISASTGLISTAASLDRESVDTYVIWCRVEDGGSPSLSSEMNVTITINDLNDNDPVFNETSYDANVLENSAVGTNILTVAATDADTGVNANLSYSIDTSTTSGARADIYLQIDAYYGVISVKSNIDRESDSTFTFVVTASDAGSPVRSATVSTTITVQDENDNNPIFPTTFYNTEVPYNDNCASVITTLLATDADTGINAELSYYLVSVPDSDHFQLGSSTGELTLASDISIQTYTMYAHANDGGTPQLTTGTSATIRIDGFSAPGVVLSFYMSINSTAYISAESTFLSQLTAVYSPTYSTCSVKRWCITDQTSSIIVHVYVIQDNITDSYANINSGKTFLHGSDSFNFVASDDSGTPSSSITGSSWDYFAITRVLRYTESSTSTTDTPWIETTAGLATVIILSVGGAIILIASTVVIVDYCRNKKKLKNKENGSRTELTESSNNNKVKHRDSEKDGERPPSYSSGRYRNFNKGDPNLENVPDPVFVKPPKVTKGYIDTSTPSVISDGGFMVKNRQFDGRAVDPGSGRVYEYSTQSNERNWIHTPEGDPVYVSHA